MAHAEALSRGGSPWRARSSLARRWAVAVAAALAWVLASTAWASPADLLRLAVLEFSGDLELTQRMALADVARGEALAAGGPGLFLITRDNMEVMLTDMGVDPTCVSEGACEVETARNLQAHLVVTGNVVRADGVVLLFLKLHDARTGRLVGTRQVRGSGFADLLGGIGPATRELVSLAVAPPTVVGPPAAGASSADVQSGLLGTLKWVPTSGGIWVMEREVTHSMWTAVMGRPPATPGCGPTCPVTGVSYDEAVAFAEAVSAREGSRYRLPTGEEWLAIARAGTTSTYAGGEELWDLGWYDRNSEGSAHPGCMKKPNAYGVCDLSGNVWEWTSTGDAALRQAMGGSYSLASMASRLTFSQRLAPSSQRADLGFRVVREAK
jgi:hypothetical protein